jgi:hypothetical protein
VAYPSFDDEDGEPLQLNPPEVVWIGDELAGGLSGPQTR